MNALSPGLDRRLSWALLLLCCAACDNPRYNPEVVVASDSVTFTMGADNGAADERPMHMVTTGRFAMERFEVTVAAYQACVEQGACTPPDNDAVVAQMLSPEACNYGRDGQEQHPINCVTQKQAEDYCRWEGRRLPTEPEWELAARGTVGSTYPWGNDAPATQLCWARTPSQGTCPVGSFPRTLLGLLSSDGLADLGGNVWEWTSSGYCPYDGGACMATVVVRGGSWDYGDPPTLRASKRLSVPDIFASASVGLRCARSVP